MNRREIKFRAWDKIKKRFVTQDEATTYPYFLIDLNGNITLYSQGKELEVDFFVGDLNNPFETYQAQQSLRSRFELLQFTGLHDKNSKEIYEGDIVKDEIGKREVKIGFSKYTDPDGFNHEFYGVYGRWLPVIRGNFDESYFNKDDDDLEVIGNIYENPELLK